MRDAYLPSTKARLGDRSIPEPMSGCTLWLGALISSGYGFIKMSDGTKLAHRVAWEEENGPIPEGLVIHHTCENRQCINPDHLRAVTHRENLMAADNVCSRNAAKTHCPKGHPYSERRDKYGTRRCRVCQSEATKRANARRKGMML